jgi:hypothetical protein
MTANHTAFYIEILESRRRFLNKEIAKVGRWDDAFNVLSSGTLSSVSLTDSAMT